jgi:hypothetical protein
MMPANQRRIGADAMGLYLIDMTIWILGMIVGIRGHIPQYDDYHAVGTAPTALPIRGVMGVFATATFVIGVLAAVVWATVWIAIKLI